MAIITLLTDFGLKDHYVAAVKARILSTNPGIQIVDISHLVPPGDLAYGSFLLRSVYKNFPPGTIHLVAIDDPNGTASDFIAVKAENYFFMGADNGLIGLVTSAENYLVSKLHILKKNSSFPCFDILAPAAAQLASGKEITDLGTPQNTFKKMLNRHMRINQDQIIGHVIHVDHYGNLITNIDKESFEKLTHNRSFYISFGRESSGKINEGYFGVEPGECFVIFNHLDLMEIGIKQGKATSLLGLKYDSSIIISLQ
ncbi:MAG: SAM-dependent chlorinase/fluorinase [Cyclobacteriaceae bacterium]|nr:SAM-dependent chlorinase/fluorinase [Cyclobacteriaceae bacterium]